MKQELEKSEQIFKMLFRGLNKRGFRLVCISNNSAELKLDRHIILLNRYVSDEMGAVCVRAYTPGDPKGLSHTLGIFTIVNATRYLEKMDIFLKNPKDMLYFMEK